MWCRKILELLPYKEIGDTRINKERTKDYNIYYDYTYTHTSHINVHVWFWDMTKGIPCSLA